MELSELAERKKSKPKKGTVHSDGKPKLLMSSELVDFRVAEVWSQNSVQTWTDWTELLVWVQVRPFAWTEPENRFRFRNLAELFQKITIYGKVQPNQTRPNRTKPVGQVQVQANGWTEPAVQFGVRGKIAKNRTKPNCNMATVGCLIWYYLQERWDNSKPSLKFDPGLLPNRRWEE